MRSIIEALYYLFFPQTEGERIDDGIVFKIVFLILLLLLCVLLGIGLS